MSYDALKRQLGLNDDMNYVAPGTTTGSSTKTFAPRVYIAPPSNAPTYTYTVPVVAREVDNKQKETYQINKNDTYYDTEGMAKKEKEIKDAETKTDVMEYVKWGAIGAGTLLVLAIIFK